MSIGYYINLKHREDRKLHFEKIKSKFPFFKNVKRFDAIINPNGALGCSMSHHAVLSLLEEETRDMPENTNVIVCEDDFFIFNKDHFDDFLNSYENIKDDNWSVLTLTPRGDSDKNYKEYINQGFLRITDNQTMSGYIVKKNFIPILRKTLEKGIQGMKNGGHPLQNTCDQIWKTLQHEYVYIYYNKIYGGQVPSVSDLEGRFVNYNQRFLMQINH